MVLLQKNVDELRRRMMPAKLTEATVTGGVVRDRPARISMEMRTYKWVLAVVGLVALYFYGFASDRYATTSQVFVKSTNQGISAMQAPSLGGGLMAGAALGLTDSYQLKEYILSADMIDLLDRDLDVRYHYSSRDWDFFSRLSSDASQEGLQEFYRDHVKVYIAPDSGTLSIETQGFTKAFSEQLNSSILTYAEVFINKVGQDVAQKEVNFIENKLQENQQKLESAEQNLLAFQNEQGVISGEEAAVNVQTILNTLNAQLTDANTQLSFKRRFMTDTNPEVRALIDQIAGIEQTIAQYQADQITGDGGRINETGAKQQRLELQVQFAADVYKGTLETLERKQIEASQQGKFLTVVQSPRLADDAKYPNRLYNVASALVLLSIIYAVGVMVIATVQEHRDV